MAHIKISDLPKDMKISKNEMSYIFGGFSPGEPIMEGPGWNPDGVVISIVVETEIDYEEAMFFPENEGGRNLIIGKKRSSKIIEI